MRKILVIDDDARVRRYFESLLVRLGYEVETAPDGHTGLAAGSKPDIDLIISDLTMPGAPMGVDLIRQLRENKPTCPIVVISGNGDPKTVAACATIGVTEFLHKPFEMGFIRDVLARLVK
jgi:DNA-binding NtrC family response regulator